MTKYLLLFFLFSWQNMFSQTENIPVKIYPQTVAYFGIVHPIVTFSDVTTYNFSGSYTVIFPTGINLIKTEKFGFTFEVAPFIKSDGTTTKVTNFLFHPGLIFRYSKGWALSTRLAFETSGRFGSTITLSKVIAKTKTNNYYFGLPIQLRFGNDKAASIGINFQAGVTF